MVSEKICPVMSGKTMSWDKDATQYNPRLVPCFRERCMAWVPEVSDSIVCKEGYSFGFDECKKAYNGFNNVVLMHDPDCNDCIIARRKKGSEGYCRLIHSRGV